jgi:hypothetical protein
MKKSNDALSGTEMLTNDITSRVLPDCYIYISHLDGDIKYWQLPCYPETVSDTMSSTFNPTNTLGRSAPVFTFSYSGPRQISLTFRFHRDMFESEEYVTNSEPADYEDKAENFIHALQAIAVPKYNLSNKAIEPPLVGVRLGSEVFIKGIVSSAVTVNYSKPILVNEKYAGIEISFTVSEVDPYDSSSVFKNGSFRGLTATMRKNMNYN